MNKIIKWIVIIGTCLVVVFLAAIIIIPMFVDVQKYKPEIENWFSEATGRPVTLRGDLQLSLFPLAGLAFSDLHLGNPDDFEEKDFLTVESFEARVKFLPLLFKDIQVKRFILKGPKIVLVKNKHGQTNWKGIGPAPKTKEKEAKKPVENNFPRGLPIKSLAVGDFSITEGSFLWIDHTSGERREVSDVSLRLEDISLDRPIHITFSASLEGRPISVDGNLGPLGSEMGQGTIPLDLSVKALKLLDMNLKGKVINPAANPQVELTIKVSQFSPRKLSAAMGKALPDVTADPKVLNRMALKADLKGDTHKVSVSDGAMDIDDSKMNFFIKIKDFSRPAITFDLNLDKIDLDRYLPHRTEKKIGEKKKLAEKKKETKTTAIEQKEPDYAPLRRLTLNGSLRIGELIISNAKIQDLFLKIAGKNGVFNLDPVTLKLYQGDMSAKASLNLQENTPKNNIEVQADKIQIGPLLADVLQKDFFEGTTEVQLSLNMAGNDAQKIKSTLNGKGDLVFKNGAIVGIDLVEMVRNTKSAFLQVLEGKERPRTDFSEMHSSFTITNGVVTTPETTLISKDIQVVAAGQADLVNETLDFRVEPKYTAENSSPQEAQKVSQYLVPILISGNFSSPKFRPDLKGIAKKQLQEKILESSEFKKIFEKEELKPLEDTAKDLLKGIFK